MNALSIIKLGSIISINGEKHFTQTLMKSGKLAYNIREEEGLFTDYLELNIPSEIDVLYEVNSDYRVHVRGDLIEIFNETSKVVELRIMSQQFIKAEYVDSTLKVRYTGNEISSQIIFRTQDFLNKRENPPFEMEAVFKSHRDIRYHFVGAQDPLYSKELVVIFSAMSPEFTYNFNYIKTLETFPVNQLYILDDYGSQGSYYLGKNRDHSIESSVISLILHYVSLLDAKLQNVMTFGSSKGGYSALYYALKYSFGDVLSLAPSLNLGSFLQDNYPNITEYIAGEDSERSYCYLNELIYSLVKEKRASLPNIHLMVGTKDSRKEKHIEPFTRHLDNATIDYKLDIVEGVNHSELKFFAPEYLKRFLSLKYKLADVPAIYMTENSLIKDDESLTAKVNAVGNNLTFAYYWYLNDKIIKKEAYTPNSTSTFLPAAEGRYRARIFVKNIDGQMITKSTRSIHFHQNMDA